MSAGLSSASRAQNGSSREWLSRLLTADSMVRSFSLDEYHQLVEMGFFADERLELIHGVLVPMVPMHSRQAAVIRRLARLLTACVGEEAIVSVQLPITLPEQNSEPEPDLALLRPQPDDYASHHPYPQDVFLVVEVAYTSLRQDREVKAPLYAEAGIPEYWLIDIRDRRAWVMRRPQVDDTGRARYTEIHELGEDDALIPERFPACRIPLAQLFV